MASDRPRSDFLVVAGFYGLKVLLGLVLIKMSAQYLGTRDFDTFTQLLMFLALMNLIATGGTQNGLIRQIAAAPEPAFAAAAFRGSVLIWLAVSVVLGVILTVARIPTSKLLVGDAHAASAIPILMALASASGIGQLLVSILIGSRRVQASCLAQAAGMIAGSAGAAVMLFRGDAIGAVMAFAVGSLATTAAAAAFARTEPAVKIRSWTGVRPHVTDLLSYSAAFAVVSSLMPLALFGIRGLYRAQFGVEALSYWLIANRVSDVSIQFAALYVLQIYLPAVSKATGRASRAVMVRTFLVGTLAMGAIVLTFAAGAGGFVKLFLASRYIPAIPKIILYMSGDALRVSALIALSTAIARKRLYTYIGIEVGSVGLFVGIAIWLMHEGCSLAPMLGYACAYLVVTAVCIAYFWRARPLAAPAA